MLRTLEGASVNIVIGGGAGFIGAPLARALSRMGHNVTAIDDMSTGYRSSRDSPVPLVKGSLDDSKFVARVIERTLPSLYIHLASQPDLRLSWESPAWDIQRTAGAIMGVLEAGRLASIPWILLVSSGEVLGNAGEKDRSPLSERTTIAPFSPYGISHAFAEFSLASLSDPHATRQTVVRLSPVYGPGQTVAGEGGLIGSAIRQTLLRSSVNPPAIPGNGGRVRDYVYIDDAVEALLHIISRDAEGVFHVGSNVPVSDREIFLEIGKILGDDAPVNYHSKTFADSEYRVLGHGRLTQESDWECEVSFHEGMARTIKFFSEVIQ